MIHATDGQGEALGIDQLETSPNNPRRTSPPPAGEKCGLCHRLVALLVASPETSAETVRSYAQQITNLLGGHLITEDTPSGQLTGQPEDGVADAGPDLVICGASAEACSQISCILAPASHAQPIPRSELAAGYLPNSAPAAGLLVSQVRWPIRHVLLIICGQEADLAALEWTACIAGHSQSTVTVLVVVPPAPAIAAAPPALGQGLPALLGSDTGLGGVMRRVARYLVEANIDSTVRLREGPTDWQIRREVTQGDYDLVVVATHSCRWRPQPSDGDLPHLILHWSSSPTLAVRAGLGSIAHPAARSLEPS